jgi:hypothetical protein
MKIVITYKESVTSPDVLEKRATLTATGATAGKVVEEYVSSRVTFPAEYPYMILGSIPLVRGKSHKVFLPDIHEVVITD